MPDTVLTQRQLNRMTLARQLLLERAAMPVPAAIEHLIGLQAQQAQPPYAGLWTRLRDFTRDDLARLIADHTVVKASMMRATLHLVTAADYLRLRGTLQPVLTAAWEAVIKDRGAGLDFDSILDTARAFIAEQPRSFAEITALFAEKLPDADPGAVRYGVRTRLPLVQVPNDSPWSYPGNPQFTLAETWLGQPIPDAYRLPELIRRYLGAFGPASVTDMQTWSGMGKEPLKHAMEALRGDLVTYRDEGKRELFDLPDMPAPDEDTPAPARFLPEFDNLLLAHQKRTRVIADAHRSQVYLPGLRVAATILVDGFVAGVWKVEKAKGAATLRITPFAALPKAAREALTEEGERLLRFIEAGAKRYEVRVDA